MPTPASVYQSSPREYPRQVPEPEYPDTMLVRSVKHQGQFRWKQQDVFLTEVFGGEQIGLLPVDERWFTIYFAQWPLAHFDSVQLRIVPWPKNRGFAMDGAGDGEVSPSPAPHPLKIMKEQKVSGMCPV